MSPSWKIPISIVPLLCLLAFTACGPGGASSPSGSAPQRGASSARTLVLVARGEPPSLASRPLVPFSGALTPPITLFNATLDFTDERGNTYPVLATALPQLN